MGIIFGVSKMASIMKIGNRMKFATRMFSTSSTRMSGHAVTESDWKRWRSITFFVAIPAILAGHFAAFRPYFAPLPGEDPHARPDFVKYEYLRIRSKKFPWGDGNHSLFHNKHANALPDGYEEDDHH